jgi:hypothetical protein
MNRLKNIKTSFTAGEVSPELLGRGDLRATENGAYRLRNVFINPTGGVTRRAGLRYIDQVAGLGRLISYELNIEQTYLIVLTHLQMRIYWKGVLQTTLVTPYVENDIGQMSWTQSADTLLLMNGKYAPRSLRQSATGVWSFTEWVFFTNNNVINQPYFKFAASNVTLAPSATNGTITLTASAPVFEAGHINTRIRIQNKEVQITAVSSSTVATASVIQTLTSNAPTIDWKEQAFSTVRGFPMMAVFHQDRLVIAGSRDLPNRIWFSRTGDQFNFDLGTGLDDEAIEFSILSDQINAIRGIFSGRHLQVFTSGAEWMVTGDPLTPTTVQITRQTRIGSSTLRYIPPLDVDGATLFVARNGQELREFIYTDVEQAYRSTDLALLSRHVIQTPIDQDYDQQRRLLFLVREDGYFATLTIYRAESVAAWTLHQTNGLVKSVSCVGDSVYFLIQRGNQFFIEELRDDVFLDSFIEGQSSQPSVSWSGLTHLNGQTVKVIADGRLHADCLVSNGAILLQRPATQVIIGLAYTHRITPLPLAYGTGAEAKAVRVLESAFRIYETTALRVDTGSGYQEISFRQFTDEDLFSQAIEPRTKDIRIKSFGWIKDLTKPIWDIEQEDPFSFTLLSVAIDLRIND